MKFIALMVIITAIFGTILAIDFFSARENRKSYFFEKEKRR